MSYLLLEAAMFKDLISSFIHLFLQQIFTELYTSWSSALLDTENTTVRRHSQPGGGDEKNLKAIMTV